MPYLWDPQEAEVLRQQGQVGEADAAPDWLVNGAEAKVHLSAVKLQVWGGHNSLDCEVNRLHLDTQTWSIFTKEKKEWNIFIIIKDQLPSYIFAPFSPFNIITLH